MIHLNVRKLVLGRRLANREYNERKIGAFEGVPAMGLDGLGSSAYGPEAFPAVAGPTPAASREPEHERNHKQEERYPEEDFHSFHGVPATPPNPNRAAMIATTGKATPNNQIAQAVIHGARHQLMRASPGQRLKRIQASDQAEHLNRQRFGVRQRAEHNENVP